MISFLKLTENDKRLIIVLLLLVILLFVISGYVGLLVKKIMTHQANKMEDMVHDVVKTGVINDSKHLRKYGTKKNHRQLFKEARIPVIIMLAASLSLLLYCLINQNFAVNVFDIDKYGIGTLFFHFDWDNAPKAKFFGLELISDWPPLYSAPHWSWDAWGAYLFVPGMFVGGIWFLVNVQAYIARSYRLFKLSKTIFNKSLDNFNPDQAPRNPINPE